MDEWPRLSHPEWRQTYDTVHMWTQVAGKICLALTPLTNHFWNITLRVTPRGLVTPLLCHEGRALTIAGKPRRDAVAEAWTRKRRRLIMGMDGLWAGSGSGFACDAAHSAFKGSSS